MQVDSILDDTVFKYFKKFGTGNLEYLGNWNNSLPKNLNSALYNFNWATQITRDIEEINKYITEDTADVLHSIGFFNKFDSQSNIKWKIIESNDLNVTWNSLYTNLDQYFSTYKVWISQIPSGCCIPQHLDTIDAFVNQYNIDIEDIENIKRLVILPNDIEPWHHLWYGKDILNKSVAGDVYKFNFWEPHGGSNLGPEPKYTIQVIGV